MKLAIGSDKSGFMLKEAVKKYLIEQGHKIEDLGTREFDKPDPFFDVAPIVARKVQSGEVEKGMLFCGTGMGMSIVLEKA